MATGSEGRVKETRVQVQKQEENQEIAKQQTGKEGS